MNQWIQKNMKIKNKEASLFELLKPRRPTGNFYESSYACPYCNDWLYKTIFPIGKEYPIRISNGKIVRMKRVFSCAVCKVFFTAAIDKLADGVLYELKLSNKNEYAEWFWEFNQKGSTEGRPD